MFLYLQGCLHTQPFIPWNPPTSSRVRSRHPPVMKNDQLNSKAGNKVLFYFRTDHPLHSIYDHWALGTWGRHTGKYPKENVESNFCSILQRSKICFQIYIYQFFHFLNNLRKVHPDDWLLSKSNRAGFWFTWCLDLVHWLYEKLYYIFLTSLMPNDEM